MTRFSARFFGPLILLALASACAKETIVHDQNETEAIRIVVLLNKEGIEAQKLKNEESRELAFNIVVNADEKYRAMEILKNHNLPEQKRDSTADLFKEGGMIPTSEAERAKREVGITGDIVNSLRRIPRVIEAAATVSIPEDNPLRDVNEAKPKPKASVFLIYLPDEKNLPPVGVEDVQRFVQAALPELRSTEVSVQMIPSSVSMANGSAPDAASPNAPLSANACEKTKTLGIDVCISHQSRLRNGLVGAVLGAGLLAAMAIFSVLRALRYRKDLTRLTAQVAQLKR